MSAADSWAPSAELRAATESAMRFWRVHHPNRRVPPDHDHAAELREYCRALSVVQLGAVDDVAEAVLDMSKGHWPSIVEVRKCARAFALRAEDRAAGWPERIDSVIYDDNAAIDAQCAAILRGLGLDGSDAGTAAQSRGITTVMESVTFHTQKGVANGTIPKSRMADLRAGTWPTPAQLEREAKRLSDAAARLKPRTMPTIGDTTRAVNAAETAMQGAA
jgi:hypothetical protein